MKFFISLMYFLIHKLRYSFASDKIPIGTHLIVGLGNPGKIYESTRHNAGQQFVKFLAKEFNVKMKNCAHGQIGSINNVILFNPVSFMNLSGNPIKKVAAKASIPTIKMVVVHDDLSSLPGKSKIKIGGSAEGHNGLKSIIEYLDD
jgi:PTH1 family peptidyl-tRNA hydrolase